MTSQRREVMLRLETRKRRMSARAWPSISRLLVPAVLLSAGGCLAPLKAPSAFASETYLCDQEHAAELDARVEECREARARDQSCQGIISFQGVIDSRSVVVDAPLFKVTFQNTQQSDGSATRLVTLNGDAPYFAVRLDLDHFAVPPALSPSGPVPVPICMAANAAQCAATNILNLEVRGANYLTSLVSEIRDVRIDTAEDLRVALTANLSRDGYIALCFHVFPPPAP